MNIIDFLETRRRRKMVHKGNFLDGRYAVFPEYILYSIKGKVYAIKHEHIVGKGGNIVDQFESQYPKLSYVSSLDARFIFADISEIIRGR